MKSAVIGAIIGDVIGSTREFRNTKDYNFELFPEGSSYTDDTICTLAIASAILNGKPFPYADCLKSLCTATDWYLADYPMAGAFGSVFSTWLKTEGKKPLNSFGNGAAMRVSPVGWAFLDEKEVLEQAKLSAECTHNHPEGIKGAQTIALCISRLAHTFAEKEKIIPILEKNYGKDYIENLPEPGEWNTSCQGCVPLAIHLFLESKNFEDAIRKAVSYGGDSDTIAAITGSLAGSYYDIPKKIYQPAIRCLHPYLLKILEEFTAEYGPSTCSSYIYKLFMTEPDRLYMCAGIEPTDLSDNG